MEILYVIGMIAVFVLCLALLSTARRILRATPLSVTQTGISRTYDIERVDESDLTESSARLVLPRIETARLETTFESTLVLDEPLVSEATTDTVMLDTVAAAESVTDGAPNWSQELAEEAVSGDSQTSMWSRFPKPTRQTYNYALECVLIGVSAWVLIQTQRDALRYRSTPSHGRVA